MKHPKLVLELLRPSEDLLSFMSGLCGDYSIVEDSRAGLEGFFLCAENNSGESGALSGEILPSQKYLMFMYDQFECRIKN